MALYLAAIYEELALQKPLDLRQIHSQEELDNETEIGIVFANNLAEKLKQFLENEKSQVSDVSNLNQRPKRNFYEKKLKIIRNTGIIIF